MDWVKKMQLTVDIIIDADIRIGILPGTKNSIKRFISSLIELLKDGGLQIYPLQKDERNVGLHFELLHTAIIYDISHNQCN